MSLKFLYLCPTPEQQRKAWSWEASLFPTLPALLPVQTSHRYFISCSWLRFERLFHVLKSKCGKHYQHPPWIFVVVVRGRGDFSFLFSSFASFQNFFFVFCFFFVIVECVKWSKANLTLTKFKKKIFPLFLGFSLRIHTGLCWEKDLPVCSSCTWGVPGF